VFVREYNNEKELESEYEIENTENNIPNYAVSIIGWDDK